MSVTLRSLTLAECQQVRIWRNSPDVLPMLRTGSKTEDQQATFYHDVVCNPWSEHKYYAIEWNRRLEVTTIGDPTSRFLDSRQFIGMGGLTYLNRKQGEAEISLILGPDFRDKGLGRSSVDALLKEAFETLNLVSVIGECFETSPAREFWERMLERRPPVSRSWRWER
jgi:RimJ/RimL family protein N-acetyltransferase